MTWDGRHSARFRPPGRRHITAQLALTVQIFNFSHITALHPHREHDPYTQDRTARAILEYDTCDGSVVKYRQGSVMLFAAINDHRKYFTRHHVRSFMVVPSNYSSHELVAVPWTWNSVVFFSDPTELRPPSGLVSCARGRSPRS